VIRTRTGSLILHLMPILIPFAALFMTGIIITVLQSFGIGFALPEGTGFLSAYREVFQSPFFLASVRHSLWIGLVSASVSVMTGMFLALLIWNTTSRVKKYSVVYKIPLILPHITVAFIVMIIFSQSGLLASLAYQAGLLSEPADFPNLFYNKTGTGIILSYIWKEVPFATLMILSVLQKLDIRYIQTGTMLGAGFFRKLRHLILPHIAPAVHTTFIILFLYSFGAFDIPFLVGESSPQMLSITVFNLYFRAQLSSRPQAMAILTMMFLFSMIFITLYTRAVTAVNPKARRI